MQADELPPSAAGDRSSYEAMRTAGTAGAVAGLVGTAAGVVLLATAPKSPPAPKTAAAAVSFGYVSPWIGAGSAGIAGRF